MFLHKFVEIFKQFKKLYLIKTFFFNIKMVAVITCFIYNLFKHRLNNCCKYKLLLLNIFFFYSSSFSDHVLVKLDIMDKSDRYMHMDV